MATCITIQTKTAKNMPTSVALQTATITISVKLISLLMICCSGCAIQLNKNDSAVKMLSATATTSFKLDYGAQVSAVVPQPITRTAQGTLQHASNQIQVYFTILFTALAFGERPTRAQWLGGGVALAGMAIIASARWGHASLWPFALTLVAALCWGAGNVVGKRIGRVDPIAE